MGLAKLKSDVEAAAQRLTANGRTGIKSIRNESDSNILITYSLNYAPRDIVLRVVCQDVGEYPDGNIFAVSAEGDDPLEPVSEAVGSVQNFLFGLRFSELAINLSNALRDSFSKSTGGTKATGETEHEEDESDDETEYGQDDDEVFYLDYHTDNYRGLFAGLGSPQHKAGLRDRLRRDLRAVREAGFRVGTLQDIENPGGLPMISASIRIRKLGLPEEAMKAWYVDPDDYFVLLMSFNNGYKPFDAVMREPAVNSRLVFRVGKCRRYKPSIAEACEAFSIVKGLNDRKGDEKGKLLKDKQQEQEMHEFWDLFVSNSLSQFLNESFVSLLKIRFQAGSSWEDANEALQGRIRLGENYTNEGKSKNSGVESAAEMEDGHILSRDHLAGFKSPDSLSLPLLAMQLAVRHFMRCTDYCLTCHRRVEKEFQALRPYVCSDPLCLFQFLDMGLGSSVEHEIITQPRVVDLLVSLCYAALDPEQGGSLPIRTLPEGLRLHVPNFSATASVLQGRLTVDKLVIFDTSPTMAANFILGKWIAFRIPDKDQPCHAVISHVKLDQYLVITIDKIFEAGSPYKDTVPANCVVQIFPYAVDFDSLDHHDKGAAMRHILNTLPPIMKIRDFLESNPRRMVRDVEGVSAAAAMLLQWIVLSNRSYIVQVDEEAQEVDTESQWIPGMPGWFQFRFTQGSPDREMRFNRALQAVAADKYGKKLEDFEANPTMFAWHGSRLYNWHSIIRNGLDFKEVVHGRAYGDGVYFSHNYGTSNDYADHRWRRVSTWPNSILDVQSCMSLNEIINAPEQFQSRYPHLVVAQPDWHQCRYLFALAGQGSAPPGLATSVGHVARSQGPSTVYHTQVFGHKILGPMGFTLDIPISAIPRRVLSAMGAASASGIKRSLLAMQDDSGDEDEELKYLYPDDPRPYSSENSSKGNPGLSTLTDFQPGTLELSTLPRLAQPSFRNPVATKTLTVEIKRMQEAQDRTPLHELGWYMDVENISNMFQWIVELHSFDAELPLARDMKNLGIRSIVLEVRFGENYPMSPPFVRVVRPRFLPFSEGGGGHVTIGGAICMELLTGTGWSVANNMESVLLQVRMAISSVDPRPARLEASVRGFADNEDYGLGEAIDAYRRFAQLHGWSIPQDFEATARGLH
ncbi:hypothetical protein QBC47DRAFT_449369 [Echria macrotheca]|uniref:UBC core domain-containing protein n=1 Tax=Echria macrotheca TaxID=438768 RepID=A0AAJ0FGS3_9PEZI|nr:hypothetical protein QBC47DRAFT_449369 [Echria macrotheca]